MRLSYHWLKEFGHFLLPESLRTPLPECGIAPGGSIITDVLVEVPRETGKYTLVLTMVQENVVWLEEIGFDPARVEVEVL